MKQKWILAVLFTALFTVAVRTSDASVGLPTETFALPVISGWAQVCVWDAQQGAWTTLDSVFQPTSYDYAVPAWNRWYWFGVWDFAAGGWVKQVWFVHLKTDG